MPQVHLLQEDPSLTQFHANLEPTAHGRAVPIHTRTHPLMPHQQSQPFHANLVSTALELNARLVIHLVESRQRPSRGSVVRLTAKPTQIGVCGSTRMLQNSCQNSRYLEVLRLRVAE